MNRNNLAAHQYIFYGVSAVLGLAILPLPYSFYTPINLIVALAAALLVFVGYRAHSFGWSVPGLAGVICYLPAFNQPFEKSTWVVLDLIFIGVFVASALVIRGRVLEGLFSE